MKINDFHIYLIFEIIIAFIFIKCYEKLSLNKPIIKKNTPIIIIICSLIILNNVYNFKSLITITSFILTISIFYFVFKEDTKTLIINTLVFAVTSIILEIFIFSILAFFIKNIPELNESAIYKCLFSVIECIFTYVIICFKPVLLVIKKIRDYMMKYADIRIAICLILLLLCINMTLRMIETSNTYSIIASISCNLFLILFIKIILNDKYNLNLLKENNKNIKDIYSAYYETIESYSEFKHNINNDLYGLKTFLPKEHQSYTDKLIKKYNKNYNFIANINSVPEGLQGIIFIKLKEAKKKNINISVNTNKIIKTKNSDYLRMCSIIGILLDNAIEATKNAKSKNIEINITENDNLLTIKIINLFKNYIDINKIGKKKYSTKEYKSGIGLNYIKKLKRSNINVDFEIINDLFISKIKYKKTNKV